MEQMLNVLTEHVKVLESWSDLTKSLEVSDSELVKEMVYRFEIMKNDLIGMNQCLILTIYNTELALHHKEDKELAASYIEKICKDMEEYKVMFDNFAERNEQLVDDLQLLYKYNYEGLNPKEWLKVKHIDNHYYQLQNVFDYLNEELN